MATMDFTASQTSTTLLRQVASGIDRAAEYRFYGRYQRLTQTVSLAMGLPAQDCDDLVQEVMTVAMQHLREGRYQRDRAGFRSWFKGIVRHKVWKAREAATRVVRPSASLPETADPSPDPAAAFEAVFDAGMLMAMRDEVLEEIKLDVEPETWQAFCLKQQGWKSKQIARHLGTTVNAVDIAVCRIRQRLEERTRVRRAE